MRTHCACLRHDQIKLITYNRHGVVVGDGDDAVGIDAPEIERETEHDKERKTKHKLFSMAFECLKFG